MDNLDSRGILRGSCNACGCSGYSGGSKGMKCITSDCGHPPGKHQNLSLTKPASISGTADTSQDTAPVTIFSIGAPLNSPQLKCQASGCKEDAKFDLNTGCQHQFCDDHIQTDSLHDLSLSPRKEQLPQSQSISSTDSVNFSPPSLSFLPSFLSPPPKPVPFPFTSSSMSVLPSQPPTLKSSPKPALPPDQCCKVQGCNRPRHREQDGTVHECCGRTHSLQYKRQQAQGSAVSSDMQCKTPGCPLQRCSMDGGKGYYDYCSISCRDSAQTTPSPRPNAALLSASAPNLQGPGTCSFPGCSKPNYVDPANQRVHPYCGRTHAYMALNQGIQPVGEKVEIKPANPQVLSTVSKTFMTTWIKGSKPSTVDFVFVITNTKLEQRWQSYKQKLSNQAVEEYYHGTKLTCDIKVTQRTCTDKNCGVCGIAMTGFDRRYIQRNITFARFGSGFYLAPNSSKCHDYTQTQGVGNYRAMVLCDVCPGNKYTLQKTTENLTGPPQGYDSVYGKTGQSLNYPEIVLYNPDSILPRFIVVYQKDGTKKIAK